MTGRLLNSRQAMEFLEIDKKLLENYSNFSGELKRTKIGQRWFYDYDDLVRWKENKNRSTVLLNIKDYEISFKFAIKMVYGGLSLNGIRGQRTEVQAADDVILGILAEHAIQKYLLKEFNLQIFLDEEVHTSEITPQDFDYLIENGEKRRPKIGVGVKASKFKSSYLVLGSNEVEFESRVSDVYIFARVALPSDHLFRIIRDHSFFKEVKDFLESTEGYKKILELEEIPVWICGFAYKEELEKVNAIPGQDFTGHRYVKSVANLHNSVDDWNQLISKL